MHLILPVVSQGRMRLICMLKSVQVNIQHLFTRHIGSCCCLGLLVYLWFCAHIRRRRYESLVQPMSTATRTGHCLNRSSSLFRECRRGVLWLDLLCYSQIPRQPCSQAVQRAALLTQLLEGQSKRAEPPRSVLCRGQRAGQGTGKRSGIKPSKICKNTIPA